ncbi:hypothetical protein ACLPBN_21010 [Klebsiella pneumoniae]|nr:hypothetical protein [Klebsiella pneumoniae]MEC4505578.1 hypothetical protein [Klebsiella pneumoniae]QGV85823.1 hypothetical protein F7P08_00535 [Klebsiella pneumoniae]
MDSVHHIWCPLSSQEYQDLPDGAETTLTTKGVEIKNLTFNGKSACGMVSGVSVSGRGAVNDFVIPDYDGDSIYLKFEEIDGHASPALEAYEAAKRKYCKN